MVTHAVAADEPLHSEGEREGEKGWGQWESEGEKRVRVRERKPSVRKKCKGGRRRGQKCCGVIAVFFSVCDWALQIHIINELEPHVIQAESHEDRQTV